VTRDTHKALYDVHAWAGFLVGVALFVICVSGAVAVFNPEIDRWANPALRVKEIGPIRVDADAAVERLGRHAPMMPSETVYLYLPGDMPGLYGMHAPTETEPQRKLYLNAYTGELTAPRNNHVYNFLRHLHVRFLLDRNGRLVVGLIGMAMLVSVITGVLIYKHVFRDLFRMRWRRTKNPRLTLADLHRLIGVWALVFHLVIAATGAWLGLEAYATQAVKAARGLFVVGEPAAAPSPASAPASADTIPTAMASLSPMIVQAQAAMPGLEPRSLELEGWGAQGAEVTIRGNLPGLVQHGAARARFDGVTGVLLEVYDVRRQSGWARLRYALEPLHYGYYGGVWLKICYLLLGLLPALLSVTGALIWFERRKTHAAGDPAGASAATKPRRFRPVSP